MSAELAIAIAAKTATVVTAILVSKGGPAIGMLVISTDPKLQYKVMKVVSLNGKGKAKCFTGKRHIKVSVNDLCEARDFSTWLQSAMFIDM